MKQLLLAVLIIVVLGCRGKEEEKTPAIDLGQPQRIGNIILPLKVGTSWIYHVYAMDTSTQKMRVFLIDTMRVLRDTVIENTRWHEIDGLQGGHGYAVNWSDGLWFVRPGDQPFLFAKYPAEAGDEYKSVISGVEVTTKVVASDQKVTSPAGEFFCYKYAQSVGPDKVTTNYYFAPGVGLIRTEIMDRSGVSPAAFSILVEVKGR